MLNTETTKGGVLQKKAVLKKFAIFTGKHLCWGHFFNKKTTLLKRDFNTDVLNISKFFYEYLSYDMIKLYDHKFT